MYRRRVLGVVVAVTVGVAGCTGDGDGESGTTTRTDATTATQAQNLGTIEYTVTNEDDETHDLSVQSVNAAGDVVQETFEPAFEPGESISSGDAGLDRDTGPYTLTFSTGSAEATYEWDVRECARVDLRVTVTGDGTVTVEETLCQN